MSSSGGPRTIAATMGADQKKGEVNELRQVRREQTCRVFQCRVERFIITGERRCAQRASPDPRFPGGAPRTIHLPPMSAELPSHRVPRQCSTPPPPSHLPRAVRPPLLPPSASPAVRTPQYLSTRAAAPPLLRTPTHLFSKSCSAPWACPGTSKRCATRSRRSSHT